LIATPALRELFFSFFKLGSTAFGGPAMVAQIRKMAVERKQWLDDAAFRSGVALCQMVPGATAMQTAAYVGLRSRGIPGAAASFIGFGLPAFLIMLLLSALYVRTHELPVAVSLFNGLQAIVVAIVANAAFTFGKNWLAGWRSGLIALTAAIMFGFSIHPILVILLAALSGLGFRNDQPPQAGSAATDEQPRSAKALLLILIASCALLALLFFLSEPLFNLALLMVRIDLFAFGGGFSSLPLMFNEVVTVHSWMGGLTFMDGIALGQITPGPIVITATFIGYMIYGIAGSIVATVFIFLPSFLLVTGTAPHYDRLRSMPLFNRALQGILFSFVGLLLSVTIRLALNIPWDIIRAALACGAFAALLFKIEIYWVVLIGIIISVLVL
jgi:chromate transporter